MKRFLPLHFLSPLAGALIAAFMPVAAFSADRTDKSLALASRWLVSRQDPATGAIQEARSNQTAMTSLAVLALASMGHQPSDPSPEGQAMKKAIAFVLKPDRQTSEGYFGNDGSRMYGHGITTLMLSEMLGMGADTGQDEQIRAACKSGIDLILRAQKVPKRDQSRGGWRYTPNASDSDLSVTVWQTMALRAAKNAGLDVPKEAIDEAVKYIKLLYEPERNLRGVITPGGFGYSSKGHTTSTTAEGLLAMQVCGEYESEEVRGAADRLLATGIQPGERWFLYTTYYYAQGMYQRGGKHAETGTRVITELLLPLQSSEGWWNSPDSQERGAGKIYSTSLAVLSLAVKNHYLPIYQR